MLRADDLTSAQPDKEDGEKQQNNNQQETRYQYQRGHYTNRVTDEENTEAARGDYIVCVCDSIADTVITLE